MFKGLLPSNVNAFATTASNATTSSYACYFDKWLEDSDKENLQKETLETQFKIVKKETNTSTVCQFGDMKISNMTVGTFQGEKSAHDLAKPPPHPHYPPNWFSCGRDAVPGPQVPLEILKRAVAAAKSPQEAASAQNRLDKLLKNRKFMEDVVHRIAFTVTGDAELASNAFTANL